MRRWMLRNRCGVTPEAPPRAMFPDPRMQPPDVPRSSPDRPSAARGDSPALPPPEPVPVSLIGCAGPETADRASVAAVFTWP